MNMPIQRQSESFGIFDDGPRFARDRSDQGLPKGLAGLVNSMGPRIQAGLLNTRQAAAGDDAYDPGEGPGYPDWLRKNRGGDDDHGWEEATSNDYLFDEMGRYRRDRFEGRESARLAVNVDGMDPDDHAYHTEDPYGPGGGWVGDEDGHRAPRREWNPDHGYEPTDEDERRAEGVHDDDESGYNWGPVPPEHLGSRHPFDRAAARRLAETAKAASWFDGRPDHADASWAETGEGWEHPVTGCRVRPSSKYLDEWEMVAPTTSKRKPYTVIDHHPDPQAMMDRHDRAAGYGPKTAQTEPISASRTASNGGLDWKGDDDPNRPSGHDAYTEVGDLIQTHPVWHTEPAEPPRRGTYKELRHLPPKGWGYGIWTNEPPEDGDYHGSDDWRNGGDRDGEYVHQGNSKIVYPTHDEAKAAAEAHYYSLDHAGRSRDQHTHGEFDSGVDYSDLNKYLRPGGGDDDGDDFGRIFGSLRATRPRTASLQAGGRPQLDDLTQRKALNLVREWMHNRYGDEDSKDSMAPSGQRAYESGSGLKLHPSWTGTWQHPFTGEMMDSDEGPSPAILHEGIHGWADDASFDEDLTGRLRDIGVGVGNWYGNVLTLHPHQPMTWPKRGAGWADDDSGGTG